MITLIAKKFRVESSCGCGCGAEDVWLEDYSLVLPTAMISLGAWIVEAINSAAEAEMAEHNAYYAWEHGREEAEWVERVRPEVLAVREAREEARAEDALIEAIRIARFKQNARLEQEEIYAQGISPPHSARRDRKMRNRSGLKRRRI